MRGGSRRFLEINIRKVKFHRRRDPEKHCKENYVSIAVETNPVVI